MAKSLTDDEIENLLQSPEWRINVLDRVRERLSDPQVQMVLHTVVNVLRTDGPNLEMAALILSDPGVAKIVAVACAQCLAQQSHVDRTLEQSP